MSSGLNKLLNNNFSINISQEIVDNHQGKVVLITGAAGSIGSELASILLNSCDCTLVLLDQSETGLYTLNHLLSTFGKKPLIVVGNICDKLRMKQLFLNYDFDIIYHAAAYKHVLLMEENPYESIRVNILGTKILADFAKQFNIEKFIFISTDKAVNPANVMGATKRIAELYVGSLFHKSKTKFVTTRFGNVWNSNGSVVPLFKAQIKAGGPITVTHKAITRYFMTIYEACQLVLEAGIMGNGGEIFIFDMGESIKIYDLAKKMIDLAGLRFPEDIDIEIIGIRPGEKIHEEILAYEETSFTTKHAKIKVLLAKELKVNIIKKRIGKLISLNKEMDLQKTISKMKEMVPEFVSNNSKYL